MLQLLPIQRTRGCHHPGIMGEGREGEMTTAETRLQTQQSVQRFHHLAKQCMSDFPQTAIIISPFLKSAWTYAGAISRRASSFDLSPSSSDSHPVSVDSSL